MARNVTECNIIGAWGIQLGHDTIIPVSSPLCCVEVIFTGPLWFSVYFVKEKIRKNATGTQNKI